MKTASNVRKGNQMRQPQSFNKLPTHIEHLFDALWVAIRKLPLREERAFAIARVMGALAVAQTTECHELIELARKRAYDTRSAQAKR